MPSRVTVRLAKPLTAVPTNSAKHRNNKQAATSNKGSQQHGDEQPSTSGANAEDATINELLDALHQAVTQQQGGGASGSAPTPPGGAQPGAAQQRSGDPSVSASSKYAAIGGDAAATRQVADGLLQEVVAGVLRAVEHDEQDKLEALAREQPDLYGQVILEIFRTTKSLDVIAKLPPPLGPEPDFGLGDPLGGGLDFDPEFDHMPEPPMLDMDYDDYFAEYADEYWGHMPDGYGDSDDDDYEELPYGTVYVPEDEAAEEAAAAAVTAPAAAVICAAIAAAVADPEPPAAVAADGGLIADFEVFSLGSKPPPS